MGEFRNRSNSARYFTEDGRATGQRAVPLSFLVPKRSISSSEDEKTYRISINSTGSTKVKSKMPRRSKSRSIVLLLLVIAFVAATAWALVLSFQRFGRNNDEAAGVAEPIQLGSTCTNDLSCGKGNACLFGTDSSSSWREKAQAWSNTGSLRSYERVGRCVQDLACMPHPVTGRLPCSDGRGSCVLGTCTCAFGFSGSQCERSARAFATLIFGAKKSNKRLVQVLAWAASIRSAGSKDDILAMVTAEVPQSFRDTLSKQGIIVREVESIPLPAGLANPLSRKNWAKVFTKFQAFNFVEYAQVALMDFDAIVKPSANLGTLFSACQAEICGGQDLMTREMVHINAGVLVLRPSVRRLEHMLETIPKQRNNLLLPEQEWITAYANNTENGMSLQYIDGRFNSCAVQKSKWNETVITHFCGSRQKATLAAPVAGLKVEVDNDCWPLSIFERLKIALLPNDRADGIGQVCGRKKFVSGYIDFQKVVIEHIDACFANAREQSCSDASGCTWYSTFCASTAGDNASTVLSDIEASGNPERLFSVPVEIMDEHRTCTLKEGIGAQKPQACEVMSAFWGKGK